MSVFPILTPHTPLFSSFYDYFLSVISLEDSWKEFQKKFLQSIPLHSHLLGMGCGSSQCAINVVQNRPDLHVTALDSSPEKVKQAQIMMRELGLEKQVKFIESMTLELPFNEVNFDYVYTINSVKYWKNQEKSITECLRVLKPGGKIFIIEVDQSYYYQDAFNWINQNHVLLPIKPILEIYYQIYIENRSINLDDAQELWSTLPLINKDAPHRILGTPLLVMNGTKQHYNYQLRAVKPKVDNGHDISGSFWCGKLLD
uniref:Ubiquinone/menaquinone methyltransferase n=1 Tax=Westiella intricata UH HT-29-1 TaxID=1524912 RepID=A0A075X7I1_9CYAN|nr:ubiquinone/menaquinone methyltransferase [Westiella intricata UH HT-29-1]